MNLDRQKHIHGNTDFRHALGVKDNRKKFQSKPEAAVITRFEIEGDRAHVDLTFGLMMVIDNVNVNDVTVC